VEASQLEPETLKSKPAEHAAAWARVKAAHGILVPGGWVAGVGFGAAVVLVAAMVLQRERGKRELR
jgi:hypothetical protein